MSLNFKVIPSNKLLFKTYKEDVNINFEKEINEIVALEYTPENFKFYRSISAISSSKIEGEVMDVDSYIKHKMLDIEYLPNLTEKPNDLYNAYVFAQENELSKNNFFEAHKIIAKHLLPIKQQGKIRTGLMLIMEHGTGRIQYEAASQYIVVGEFDKLWEDIELLIKTKLEIHQVFYFASLIHIVFENIHPFNDGNGRIGRLLEKWFLATKLGNKLWNINSELYYYENVDSYYKNLQRIGLFYDSRDFTKTLPFLLMLTNALQLHKKNKTDE
jgi:Fic family protein